MGFQKWSLFLGCTIPSRARNYEMAARKVATRLEIEFAHLNDFACCGFPIKSVDHQTFLLLAARNLAVAEQNQTNICTLCNACTSILTEINYQLKENSHFKEEINQKLTQVNPQYKLSGEVKVKHFIRFLYEEVGLENIKKTVKKELKNLKVSAHYGCHYLKPSQIYGKFDDPEDASSLDRLLEITGAVPVDYPEKQKCCGGGILAIDENLALTLGRQKLEAVKKTEAEAISLICPFCSVMYDDNQRKIEANFKAEYHLPVLYYPQILGLAMGYDQKELGLNMNRVKTKELLAKIEAS
jgi:heterodisulfide reductase subunit B